MQRRESEEEQAAAATPAQSEYNQVVKDALNVAPTDSRILSYQGKTLKAQEGMHSATLLGEEGMCGKLPLCD